MTAFRYVSTRGQAPAVPFSEAVLAGLAPDGGLYVPEVHPTIEPGAPGPLVDIAERVLTPYLAGDRLAPELGAMLRAALTFPLPLKELKHKTAVLELFHGPTAAFKDVGARFLAECVGRLAPAGKPLVIVATSGDTGGAVAGAFHRRPGIDVAVLFPKGRISPRQEKQLTAWGDNVHAFRVNGTFDDCQRLVKHALGDARLRARRPLLSANSISLGRLLPQQVYYAATALEYVRRHGARPNFVIPTGNLGNAVAALWAKRAGFPIGHVVLALNANRAIADFLATGLWEPRPTVATLANAMDVGAASNMERLRNLYATPDEVRREVAAVSIGDDEIRAAIGIGVLKWGEIWCPHTATAAAARERLRGDNWVLVATAHPAKFDTIVEPLVGRAVDVPPALAALLARPSVVVDIEADERELERVIPP